MDWPTDWPADVDPTSLRQPDSVTCGPTTVVAARTLLDDGWRPDDVESEILRTHDELISLRDVTGRMQVPWPARLGTPTWAVARALTLLIGQSVNTYVARFRPEAAYEELLARLAVRPVAVYTGSPWLPRHVMLAYGVEGDGTAVRVFDPAHGQLVTVTGDRWRGHQVGVAGWSHLWAVV